MTPSTLNKVREALENAINTTANAREACCGYDVVHTPHISKQQLQRWRDALALIDAETEMPTVVVVRAWKSGCCTWRKLSNGKLQHRCENAHADTSWHESTLRQDPEWESEIPLTDLPGGGE